MTRQDKWTFVGVAVVALAAAVMSFAAWSGLAHLVGITQVVTVPAVGWQLPLAWLLPIAVDAYALVTTQVWLRPGISARTRSYAQWSAFCAIALSVAGNGGYHVVTELGLTERSWWWLVVVVVSAVPAVQLGFVLHLFSLLRADSAVATSGVVHVPAGPPVPVVSPDLEPVLPANPPSGQDRPATQHSAQPVPVVTGEPADGLLILAQAVAADLHRDDLPLTRRALVEGIRSRGGQVGTKRAQDLLRDLREKVPA